MKSTDVKKVKLSFKTLIGYGVGGLGEGISYNFFYAYFLFFLTNVVGIKPAIAGTISLIAVLWDGISDPLIGYLSDNSKNPKGRRRPYILGGSILLAFSVILLFSDFNLPSNLKVVYFIIINILYWTALTMTVIPHTSLGSELTDDFDERTNIRAYQTIFMNIGAAVAMSATLVLVTFFGAKFETTAKAWTSVAVIYGIILFLAYFASWASTKGKEPARQTTAETNKNFFGEYKNILKNKPLKYILSVDFFVNMILGISVSIRVYLYTYNFGYSEAKISSFLFVYSIAIILGVLLVKSIANSIGKKNAMIAGIISYTTGFLVLFIFPSTQFIVILGLLFEAYGNCTFWTLLYSLAYDTSVVEEYKHEEGKEGIIVSLVGLTMKAGNAIGMWLAGTGLALIGFNAELASQSATTLTGLKMMYTLIDSGALLITLVIFVRYPLTKDKYDNLKEIVKLKSQNKPYSTDGLEKLI